MCYDFVPAKTREVPSDLSSSGLKLPKAKLTTITDEVRDIKAAPTPDLDAITDKTEYNKRVGTLRVLVMLEMRTVAMGGEEHFINASEIQHNGLPNMTIEAVEERLTLLESEGYVYRRVFNDGWSGKVISVDYCLTPLGVAGAWRGMAIDRIRQMAAGEDV